MSGFKERVEKTTKDALQILVKYPEYDSICAKILKGPGRQDHKIWFTSEELKLLVPVVILMAEANQSQEWEVLANRYHRSIVRNPEKSERTNTLNSYALSLYNDIMKGSYEPCVLFGRLLNDAIDQDVLARVRGFTPRFRGPFDPKGESQDAWTGHRYVPGRIVKR